MTKDKLPKELPMVPESSWVTDGDRDFGFGLHIQHDADQLLYDALWAENERLIKCLLNIANLLQYAGGT